MLNHVTENKLGQIRALKKPPSAPLKNAVYDLSKPHTVHKSGIGRPAYDPRAVTVLILWQFYVNKTDRATDWIKKELNLTQIPDRRTLNRYRKKITPEYLSNLNELILGQANPSKLAVDSTGLKTSRRLSAWSVKKGSMFFTTWNPELWFHCA